MTWWLSPVDLLHLSFLCVLITGRHGVPVQLGGKRVASWADLLGVLNPVQEGQSWWPSGFNPDVPVCSGDEEGNLPSTCPKASSPPVASRSISAAKLCLCWMEPLASDAMRPAVRINADISVHWAQAKERHLVPSPHWKGAVTPAHRPLCHVEAKGDLCSICGQS